MRGLIGLAVVMCLTAGGLAQDPAKVSSQQCKVMLENDYVRVLHWTIAPHEKTAMHDHPALVSVALSGGKTRYTTADGKITEVESKPGQATWSAPVKHSSDNLADKPGESIQVELKKKPGTTMVGVPPAEDPVAVDPKHYKVEFQNDRVRVLRIHYAPGEKSVMHVHPANVAVYLTDGRTKMTLSGGKTNAADFKAGQVQWAGKEAHLPKNAGSGPFELVLVELK